jgi:hypothetical protein
MMASSRVLAGKTNNIIQAEILSLPVTTPEFEK